MNFRDIQLGLKAFSLPLALDYGGLWGAVKILTQRGFDLKTRLFRRSQALEMLKAIFHNRALLERVDTESRTEIESTIVSESIEVK